MKLAKIVSAMDDLLKVAGVKDYPQAWNGLQVENNGEIRKVAAAVDACEAVLQMAVAAKADLLLVHHGLFWGGLPPVTGPAYRKLQLCLGNNLAIYSAHLPLDVHPSLGNNALLCDALGLKKKRKPFLEVGWQMKEEVNRDKLKSRLEQVVGGPVYLAPGGPQKTRRIGLVTGGAGDQIFKAAAEGVDTFITGEGSHWTYPAAEELGVNLFYAGHYATETFGVKALAAHLEKEFELPWEFLDHPTGL